MAQLQPAPMPVLVSTLTTRRRSRGRRRQAERALQPVGRGGKLKLVHRFVPQQRCTKPLSWLFSPRKMPSLNQEKGCGINSAICHYMGQEPKRALDSDQIRAGRALLRWSAEDLSRHSSVSIRTIRRAELADGGPPLTAANNVAIRRALEAAGVEFIDENGGGAGARLRKPRKRK